MLQNAQHGATNRLSLRSPEAKCFQKRVPSREELIDRGLHDHGHLDVVLQGGPLQSHLRVVIQRAVDVVLGFAVTLAGMIERALAALVNAEHQRTLVCLYKF
ncbi:hypothetical protein SM11_pC0223 (plasmid) [Sinorhizobium meliloti SM11]|uniref:Uncharacterized protein n=1 Tax=Sinorhizobium meliloti (strain SM11) TaxID=707241 RepID=F7XBS4_SINMM|nr:hypothetical protein SM11_pC0223 [Sinorhizobium meliloti SM11]